MKIIKNSVLIALSAVVIFACNSLAAESNASVRYIAPEIRLVTDNCTHHLNRYDHFGYVLKNPDIHVEVKRYRARDSSMQSYMVLKPNNKKPEHILFFFHGMDGDAGDSVIISGLLETANVIIISPAGRGPAWLSDAFLEDMTALIPSITGEYGIDSFFIGGVSMGGTQALSLAGLLPEHLKSHLKGVMALIPGVDLARIAELSSVQRVRDTLTESAGGNKQLLMKRSAVHMIHRFSAETRFAIYYSEDDSLLLADDVRSFIRKLSGKNIPAVIASHPGEHNMCVRYFDYSPFWKFLTGAN